MSEDINGGDQQWPDAEEARRAAGKEQNDSVREDARRYGLDIPGSEDRIANEARRLAEEAAKEARQAAGEEQNKAVRADAGSYGPDTAPRNRITGELYGNEDRPSKDTGGENGNDGTDAGDSNDTSQ